MSQKNASMIIKGIHLEIVADSIYRDSIARIKLTCSDSFTVTINCILVNIIIGNQNADTGEIAAVNDDGMFYIEVDAVGVFSERLVRNPVKNFTANQYGMRYYPFVSSFLKIDVQAKDQPLSRVVIDLPEEFRAIWYGANILSPERVRAVLNHSYGEKRSKFFFYWDEPCNKTGTTELSVPFRLGSTALLKLVQFPMYYWLLSLFVISAASFADKISIFLAAIAGTWIFILRYWNSSNLPQENTILTRGYIIAGGFAPIWGLSWKSYGLISILWVVPVGCIVWYVHSIVRQFKYTGLLPEALEKYWVRQITTADLKQKDNWVK